VTVIVDARSRSIETNRRTTKAASIRNLQRSCEERTDDGNEFTRTSQSGRLRECHGASSPTKGLQRLNWMEPSMHESHERGLSKVRMEA